LFVANFRELTTIRSEQNQHRVHNHGIYIGDYIHEDEIIGMYVNMSNEGTTSNGHGEGKEESMNLVETN
jgi:hypothetical protein